MKITKVKINNVLSIENAEVVFDDNGLVLVDGWNAETQRSNGAGKSSIFNAISFGLYDKIPRKITKTEILRHGCKTGFAEVTVAVGADTYSVKRERPNNVSYYKNDVVLKITQEEFERNIGLSYEEFLATLYLSQGATNRFISFSDSEKKDFILSLMKMDKFNACHDAAKQCLNTLEKELDKINSNIANDETILNNLREFCIDDTDINNKINELRARDLSIQEHLTTIPEATTPDFSRFTELEAKLKIKYDEIATIKRERTLISSQIFQKEQQKKNLRTAIVPSVECPHCSLPVRIVGKNLLPDKTQEDKENAILAQENLLNDEITTLREQLNDLVVPDSTPLDELSNKIAESKQKLFEEANQSASVKATLLAEQRTIASQIKNYEAQLTKAAATVAKIAKLEQTIADSLTVKTSLVDKIAIQQTVVGIFSPAGAPAYIMDTIVDAFNAKVNEYMDLVWANSSYKILTQKTTASNKVTTKFSEQLIMNGRECSIGSLSGGEFRALSLIIDFTMFSVINEHFGRQINPIIMDEPFDGLDIVGRETVIGLLDKMSHDKCIIVVDHSTESKTLFSKIIKVERQNGISTISY